MASLYSGAPTTRPMRIRDRTHSFWTTIEHFDDDQWKAHFRMSGNILLFGQTPAASFRSPTEPHKRVVIVLWWCATPGEYRTISRLFGVGIATVCELVH